jgi:hypothetical protein
MRGERMDNSDKFILFVFLLGVCTLIGLFIFMISSIYQNSRYELKYPQKPYIVITTDHCMGESANERQFLDCMTEANVELRIIED